MAESPKTIDNLGIWASRAYAEGAKEKELDLSFIRDSVAIPQRTEKLTLQPSYFPLELLGEKEKSTWADFPTPIAVPSRSIFGDELIPGLDTELIRQVTKSFPNEEESKTLLSFSEQLGELQKNLDLSTQGRKRFIPG